MKKYIRICAIVFLIPFLLMSCAPRKVQQDPATLSESPLADRQMQTRRFTTSDKITMLQASAGVLKDLGFTIDEHEVSLGVLVASKTRDALTQESRQNLETIETINETKETVDGFFEFLDFVLTVVDIVRVFSGDEAKHNVDDDDDDDDEEEEEEKPKDATQTIHVLMVVRSVEKEESQVALTHFTSVQPKLDENIAKDAMESEVRITFRRTIINTDYEITFAEQIKDLETYAEFFDKLEQSVFLEANEI